MTTDGQDVGLDLSGGFFDAGDTVKFTFPMLGTLTLLAWGGIEYADGYAATGQIESLRDIVRWGTDWTMKAHAAPFVFYAQIGTGPADHGYWGPAETMQLARPSFALTAEKPGSEVTAEAAAALSAASLLFAESDPQYSQLLIARAKQLFQFADQFRGSYTDSIPQSANYYRSYSGYWDELLWAAAWLHRATGESLYLQRAEAIFNERFANTTIRWTHDWDNKLPGAAILLAQMTGKQVYRTAVERWLNFWTVGDGGSRVARTSGGLAWLSQWGSLRYVSNAAFLAFLYADSVGDIGTRYRDFAKQQIHYALGDNPANRSYVVGFGTNAPRNPHHRNAHGSWANNISEPPMNRNVLFGALVGGPTAADDFAYADDRNDYVANEVALDYNSGFTGAVARLVQVYGGTPLANFPPPAELDDEFLVEARVSQNGNGFTEIRAFLNNRSTRPARASDRLAFRYYVDLSELYNAGYSVDAVQATLPYSQGATVSPLRAHDAARRIYYVEVDFSGTRIAPGSATGFRREAQLRVGMRSGFPAGAWNAANDPSFIGLTETLGKSDRIPVFESGTRLSGVEP